MPCSLLRTRGSLNAYRDLNYANKKIVDTEWSVLVPKSPFDLRAQPPSSFVLAKPPRHRFPVSSLPPFRVRVQPYPSPSVCFDFHDGTFHILSWSVRGTVGYQAIGYTVPASTKEPSSSRFSLLIMEYRSAIFSFQRTRFIFSFEPFLEVSPETRVPDSLSIAGFHTGRIASSCARHFSSFLSTNARGVRLIRHGRGCPQ